MYGTMEKADAVNVYVCESCGGQTVTVNDVSGVTPFMISCRTATIGCGGMAQSTCYRGEPDAPPAWEWYRPDEEELARLDKATREHIANGGLLLRKLDSQRREMRYGYRTRRA